MGDEIPSLNQARVQIVPYTSVESSHALLASLDRILFEASAVQSFDNSMAQARFRHRWLGRYLDEEANHAFLAIADSGAVAGYVIGALLDPARDPGSADLAYFGQFQSITSQYPAHLHINLAAQFRSGGIGSRLLSAFLDHVRARGAPGVHIVTGKGMRNVGFYARNGFSLMAEAPWKAGHVVIMARAL